jgi:hypothetical protein
MAVGVGEDRIKQLAAAIEVESVGAGAMVIIARG